MEAFGNVNIEAKLIVLTNTIWIIKILVYYVESECNIVFIGNETHSF